MRDDLLQGLSQRDRRKRVADDIQFLQTQAAGAATPEAKIFAAAAGMKDLEVYKPEMVPEGKDQAVACTRVDLDTPLYLQDNVITQCSDCGCDVQVRPDVPANLTRLCICCCARRIREKRKDA